MSRQSVDCPQNDKKRRYACIVKGALTLIPVSQECEPDSSRMSGIGRLRIEHRAGKPPFNLRENNQTPINNEGV